MSDSISQHAAQLIAKLKDHTAEVGVIGLGYVGLPLAVEFARAGFSVTGIDVLQHKVDQINAGVSYVQDVPIDVLFWERGAGETLSSGTGSTGAAASAVLRNAVESPIEVRTPAGSLPVRWDSDDLFLTGPAEIVARGEFYFESESL